MATKNTIPRFDIADLEAARRELEALYDQKLKVYSGKHHARYFPDGVPVHVISRTFQGRYLLTPNRRCRRLVGGVVGRAQHVYPEIELYVVAFLSNHFHMMLSGPATKLSRFVGYVKREISRRWAKVIKWHDTMWSSQFIATALPNDESQIRCLKYVLGQGVKEGLVSRPEQWPGIHSAQALLQGSRLGGEWFYGTGYRTAKDYQSRRKHPKPVRQASFYEKYEIKHSQIPAWKSLSAEAYREKVRILVEEIVVEGRIARNGKPPLGKERVLKIPRHYAKELPPQPWFEDRKRMICWGNPRDAEVKKFIDDYWTFQLKFRTASEAYLAGDQSAEFPRYAFRPGTSP